jgi:hypothetical protein
MHFHGALNLVWLDIREARTKVSQYYFIILLFRVFFSSIFYSNFFSISTLGRGWVECPREVYLLAVLLVHPLRINLTHES